MPLIRLSYGDPHSREVLAFWLRNAGYQVELILPAALPDVLVKPPAPDLLLLDLDLPDEQLAQVLVALSTAPQSGACPVLALTASRSADGFSDRTGSIVARLAKPCDLGELALWLTRLFGSPLAHLPI